MQPAFKTLAHAGAGGKTRVGDHQAGKPLREGGDQTQADQPAPILAEQGDILEIERQQPVRHPGDVALVGVVGPRGRLVGFAETDQVRHHHPVPGPGQHRNELAVKIGPARLAVHQQDRRGLGRPFVQVMDPQLAAVGIEHLSVMRREGIVGDALEGGIGCPQDYHGGVLPAVFSMELSAAVPTRLG